MGGAEENGGAGGGDRAAVEYRKAKTSVWWDIENCAVPKGSDAHTIAQNITAALSALEYGGPVSISAYGDTSRIPPSVQQALSSTGISLNHVPAGIKDASDKKILVDLLLWAVDNPAPANYLLISGDRDFSNALHQLCMRRYNILLAQPSKASHALVAAAKSVWLWTSLVVGSPPQPRNDSPPCINNNSSSSSSSSSSIVNNNNVYNSTGNNHVRSDSYFQAPPVHINQPVNAGSNFKLTSPARAGDSKSKLIYVPKTSTAPTIQTSLTLPSAHPLSDDVNQSCQAEPAEASKAIRKAPHEFFGPNHPVASAGWSASGGFPGNLEPVSRSKSDFAVNQQNHYSHMPRPSNGPGNTYSAATKMYPPAAHNHTFHPGQLRPQAPSVPSATSAPDLSKLSIFERPSYARNHVNGPQQTGRDFKLNAPKIASSTSRNLSQKAPNMHTSYSQSNALNRQSSTPALSSSSFPAPPVTSGAVPNAQQGASAMPPLSEYEQGLAGLVLLALDSLKNEKICPSEANITDCIRFGDARHRNTDVKKALECAINLNMVQVQNVGKLQLYVRTSQPFVWSCVNPMGGNPNEFPKAIWDKVQEFLVSSDGRSAITASVCSYEAALILKNSCLQGIALGQVIRILNMLITCKRWIKHHPSAWQPVIVTLKQGDTGKADP